MLDIKQILQDLRRPRLLVRAAKLGLSHYHRNTDLKRFSQAASKHPSNVVLDQLLIQEQDLETARKTGLASYDIRRHIGLLTAVLAEAKQLLGRQIEST